VDMSRGVIEAFMNTRAYDAGLISFDPFVSHRLINAVQAYGGQHLPIVSYVSQEGLPPHYCWDSILNRSRFCLTYSKAAVIGIKAMFGSDRKIDYVYPGVDHANFRRFDDETRKGLRAMLGWDDLFIIMNISANKRNKSLVKLLKALSLLRQQYGHEKARVLLHTSPIPDERFHGVDLEMYAKQIGLHKPESASKDRAMFISGPAKNKELGYECDIEELFRYGMPRPNELRDWFDKLGLIARYNLADLYVDVSSCEGFGLPLFEAMACGVPCISVDDQYVRREVIGEHPGLLRAWPLDIWVTGANLMLIDPEDLAARMDGYLRGETTTVISGAHASRIVGKLKWGNAGERILDAIRQCLG